MLGSRGSVLRAGGRQLTRVLGGSNCGGGSEGVGTGPSRGTREKSSETSDLLQTFTLDSTMPETKNYPTLEKLGLLSKQHIRIKDKDQVEQMLTTIVHGGNDKLQIIADYDHTLTQSHYRGKRSDSSFGVMDNSSDMPAFYRTEANQLLSKYYPIEIHPTMTEAEKIPHMVEWYERIHDLLVKCKVSKTSIKGMVTDNNTRLKLREGSEQLFGILSEKSVPVLVLSAGMGDILEEVLRHFKIYTDNVKVVANFFKYNNQGVMVGFQGEGIHMFNKNENAIHSSDYFQRLEGRTNVILMGDSLGDTKMAVGVPQPSHVLKIGFLNDKIDERLESYLDSFDIVLIDDQTMDVARAIVDLMK